MFQVLLRCSITTFNGADVHGINDLFVGGVNINGGSVVSRNESENWK